MGTTVMVAQRSLVDAWCPNCGETQADITNKCVRCNQGAVIAKTLDGMDRDSHLVKSVPSEERTWPDARATLPLVTGLHGPAAAAAMTASRQAGKPASRLNAAPPPDLTRFKLPSSAPTRKWLEMTRALGEGLSAAAAAADRKAADIEATVASQVAARQADAARHRAEAARLRNSARVITQLLEQVGIETERQKDVKPAGPRRMGHPLPPGKWSMRHERCIDCGRTDRKHSCNGRCGTCDIAWRKRGKAPAP